MPREDTLKVKIESIRKSLAAEKQLEKFFAEEIRRLDGIYQRIDKHQALIAIIGITSSGKSTLMNAILGSKILPTGVAPTSGKQVICSWDKEKHAVIVFDPAANKKPLDVTDDIEEKLRQYGNEKFNPGNREGVEEIQVFSPDFKFNHDLVFVDTPGLDAHALEEHERITMQMVLPTVDMVMYLTTVKTSSDAKNLEFMEQVMSKTKPLVIVQNMIDSIEPKISSRGTGPDMVEKTKDEVRREHFERVRRLLDKSQNNAVRNAPIVQVSAIAKDWRKSNLETLGKVLGEQQNRNSGLRTKLLERQLNDVLNDMLDRLNLILADEEKQKEIQEANARKIKAWNEHLVNFSETISCMKQTMEGKTQSLGDNCEALIADINKKYGLMTNDNQEPLGEKTPQNSILETFGLKKILKNIFHQVAGTYSKPKELDSNIKRKKDEFVSEINLLNSCFSDCITQTQQTMKICCDDLGIDEKSVLRHTVFKSSNRIAIEDFEERRKIHHDARRVKQSGWWGGVKRFFSFGHYGYDEEEAWDEEISEFNIEKLVLNIKSEYQKEVDFISQKYPVYERDIEKAYQVVLDEFEQRKSSMHKTSECIISLDEGRKYLDVLHDFMGMTDYTYTPKSLEKNTGSTTEIVNAKTSANAFVAQEKMIDAKYASHVYHTYALANEMSLDCNRNYMQLLFKRSGMNKIIVAGWTQECLQYFVNVFFENDKDIQVIDLSATDPKITDERILLVLLVNATQSGYAEKKIFDNAATNRFIRSVSENGKIIWGMDSIREHIFMDERDSLIESFCEMLRIAQKVQGNLPVFDAMACDREFYYTVLLHELLRWQGGTQNEKQVFVEDFTKMFCLDVERRDKTGKYLNQFINIKGA